VTATDLQSFAVFWRGLEGLRWSVQCGPGASEARVDVAASEPVRGATLEFQRPIASAGDGARLLPDLHRIVLPPLNAQETLSLNIRYKD